MYIIKVLKRKDAASIIVAIWVALALSQLTMMPLFDLASQISGIGDPNNMNSFGNSGPGWRHSYLNPVVSFLLQIILLEILIRLFVWAHPKFVRKAK